MLVSLNKSLLTNSIMLCYTLHLKSLEKFCDFTVCNCFLRIFTHIRHIFVCLCEILWETVFENCAHATDATTWGCGASMFMKNCNPNKNEIKQIPDFAHFHSATLPVLFAVVFFFEFNFEIPQSFFEPSVYILLF